MASGPPAVMTRSAATRISRRRDSAAVPGRPCRSKLNMYVCTNQMFSCLALARSAQHRERYRRDFLDQADDDRKRPKCVSTRRTLRAVTCCLARHTHLVVAGLPAEALRAECTCHGGSLWRIVDSGKSVISHRDAANDGTMLSRADRRLSLTDCLGQQEHSDAQ